MTKPPNVDILDREDKEHPQTISQNQKKDSQPNRAEKDLDANRSSKEERSDRELTEAITHNENLSSLESPSSDNSITLTSKHTPLAVATKNWLRLLFARSTG
ncbi:MAG: hypothetical protein HC778_02965, partial [Chamaesiphon sp. CSU_1_12]|nr:hypothetical protein [Chamaesiphon sp. CSU_1_12]